MSGPGLYARTAFPQTLGERCKALAEEPRKGQAEAMYPVRQGSRAAPMAAKIARALGAF
jgi:hypothetical protein